MEKEHFLDLAKNYTSLTIEEAHAVDDLQRAYPYSQVVRCLASRGARDHQFDNANLLLATSAVYSSDRAVLKEIMTASRAVRKQNPVVTKAQPKEEHPAIEHTKSEQPAAEPRKVEQTEAHEPVLTEVVEATKTPASEVHTLVPSTLSGEALVNEIMFDLNRLQDLKKIFETSFNDFQQKYPTGPKRIEKPAELKNESKKIAPIARPTVSEPRAKPAKPTKTAPTELTPEPSSESLLKQIETSHKPVLPDSKKQKEQLQIIDQFITKQPSIAKGVPPATDGADLAEKSAALVDSMVSETLVEILLRQGKKEKAIEVLRKLIWKFPQKKAIFAAQIEDLRK